MSDPSAPTSRSGAGRAAGNPALIEIIHREIAAAGGRITFARYMDLALYHPEHGYYRQLVRDYRTVPELHPLFGTLIGRQVAQMWELLGRPAPFRVVEMGAGRGHLARSVLEYFRRDAPPIDLRYTALDVGPRPAGLPDEVEWTDRPLESWPDGGLAGVLLSNELPDAFPVHRVVMQEGELREVYVEASPPSPPPLLPREERGAPPPPSPWKGEGRGEGGTAAGVDECPLGESRSGGSRPSVPSPQSPLPERERGAGAAVTLPLGKGSGEGGHPFRSALGPPSTPELAAHFAWLGIVLPEGHRAEVNLRAPVWMRQVARVLERGFVITVDYGYPADELYARPQGTLLCYHGQQYNDDPYRWVGQQDITAHVDFSALADAGREAGLHCTGLVAQADFLRNLGLEGYLRSLDISVAEGRLSAAYRYDQRAALRELTDRRGLGAFRVLVQYKGLMEPALDGLDPTNRSRRELWSAPPEWPW